MDENPPPESLIRWSIPPEGLARTLNIGCVSLAGVLMLFFLQWATEGTWLMSHHGRVVQLSAQFLPVPFAFLWWVSLMERSKKFTLAFSPLFCIVSVQCFVAVQLLRVSAPLANVTLALAGISGFFVFVPLGECIQRIKNDPRPALVALIAATAAYDYYALLHGMWEVVCAWTTHIVYGISMLFGQNATIGLEHPGRALLALKSPYFAVSIYPDCSGLEGIFLFWFLLSIMLLLDWDLFKSKPIFALYAFGAIYMFMLNALRIFILFTLGYWAGNPHAWAWMHSLRGAPIYLFHSYEGWFFYLLAFGLFARWMYRSVSLEHGGITAEP